MRSALVYVLLWPVALSFGGAPGGADRLRLPSLPRARTAGKLELVATFDGPMPTGVTVSHTGRIFVCFPRWGDKVAFTVAELKDGKAVAYPNADLNRFLANQPRDGFISVQSVVVDPRDRLWALDTGSINFGPVYEGGPKLVGIDLRTNQVFKKIVFPPSVAEKMSYLNDVRFDLRRGKEGMAFITDSSGKGSNAIIVVDLATGQSWQRLRNHPSTRAEKRFVPAVEGRALLNRPPKGPPSYLEMGADGIAIGHDGKRLFYSPLCSRRLFSVSADALANLDLSDDIVARTVIDHGEKGGAADGMESDAEGRVYMTNYEQNAILRLSPDGVYETLVYDPRVLWPDTLSLATDGHLYFTANQLHRMGRFHHGKDERQRPYSLFRIRVEARPVLLR
jgi:sugar lactone lactonase YvrE